MLLHSLGGSLLLAFVGPPGGRLAGHPPVLQASRRRVAHSMAGTVSVGALRHSRPELSRRASTSLVFTSEDPTPWVELYADGTVTQYTSTLTSMRGRYELSTRDVRLLRSATRVLAPRDRYLLFDLGDLKGVLQRDRVILIGADRPAVTALANEVKQRLALDRDDMPLERETPFEVRVVECMLEQTYSLMDEALQRLETLVTSTLAELTDPSQAQAEAGREAALSTRPA